MTMFRRLFSKPRCAVLALFLSLPAFAQISIQFIPNRYTVILEDPPVSNRFVTLESMRSAPAVAYRQQIERRQAEIVRAVQARNIKVTGSESMLLNAVFVTVTEDRLADLRSIPGVLGVRPMRRFKPTMNKAVQLMNAPAAWNLVGGQSNAGKGMKIGILDSGIDQTHPALQDSTLAMPAGFPKCTAGHQEDCAYTNSKVIVARSYVRDLSMSFVTDSKNPAAQSLPDDYSPRDRFGHGTAVASVAAGNTVTAPALDASGKPVAFTGMAPKAYLGNYKVSGSPGVNDGSDDQVLIEALRDAVTDGMDVVSLSFGILATSGALDTGAVCGAEAGVACDPVATAYEAAAKGGLIIVVAAGNAGNEAFFNGGQYPYFNSISSPGTAPSVITAGASTNSHVLTPGVSVNAANAPASLKGITAEITDANFAPSQVGANSGTLVDVSTVGNDGLACTALPAFSLYGAYALIKRGTCNFSDKAANAQAAGATGVVFYMADSSPLIGPSGLDCFSGSCFTGPAVMISNSDGVALKNYINANPGQAVTIDLAALETDLNAYVQANGFSPAGANQLASYTSFGPAPDGAIKPDLIAVGGFDAQLTFPISSGLYVATQNYDQTIGGAGETLYSVSRYMAVDGTSFSAPMVAGAAALVKQAHPTYTAAQVKSALVNSAAQDVTTDDFGDAVDVEWLGAGKLDTGAAAAVTVTAEPSTISLGFLKTGALPITKALTITNKGTASVTLAAAVAPNSTVAGITVAVDKPSITLAAGASTTLTVTLSGSVPTAGSYSGAVTLKATGVSLRLPYMFIVGDGVAYNANPILPFAFGTPGADGGFLAIHVTDQFGAPVVGNSVSFTVSPRGAVTLQSASGAPACTPASSPVSATCPTDNYGIAYVHVALGSNVSSPTITAKAAGTTFQLGAFIIAPPAIKATDGVVNAANFQSPVAPGSYAAILGSNLVDSDFLNSATGDSETTALLPLSLDFVNVSFDVPSAGISVPGYLNFVSSGQINLQVPWELQGQTSAQVKVIVDGGIFGNVVTVPLADFTPAFFEVSGIVAAINATQGNIVTANTPVHAGDVVELFGNGLGPVDNQPASGTPALGDPLSRTKTLPVVTIGGQPAAVSFSGLAPGFPGLYQVNVTVPSGLTAGAPSITLAIGGKTSKASTLPLK